MISLESRFRLFRIMRLDLELSGGAPREFAQIGDRATNGVALSATDFSAVESCRRIDWLDRQAAAGLADNLQARLFPSQMIEMAHPLQPMIAEAHKLTAASRIAVQS